MGTRRDVSSYASGPSYYSVHETNQAAAYLYPNDADEKERLEFQHKLLKDVLHGRNYLAPFSKARPPKKVLDVGTGTGTWAIEMGDEFPSAEIVGVDLSPIQAELVPPNVHFFIDDWYAAMQSQACLWFSWVGNLG